jgi:hypothetical protein
MQRRSNWKPVIVPNGQGAENGEVSVGETPHPTEAPTREEDRLVDFRFAIATVLALGLPALIGVGLYLAATIVLRSS